MSARATSFLLFLGLIWGGSFLLIDVALDELTPLQITLCRAFGGALTLWLFVPVTKQPVTPSLPGLLIVALLAAVGTLLPYFLIPLAQEEVDSGVAAVYNSLTPLFAAVLAPLFFSDERLTRDRLAGVTLGIGGSLLIAGGALGDLTGSDTLAQGALVLAALAYACGAIIIRFALRYWRVVPLSAFQMAFLTLFAAVILVPTGELPSLDFEADTWLAVAGLGVLSSGVGYVAYAALVDETGAVRSSLVSYVIPVVGVVLGALVLDETVTWNTVAGGIVMAAGVAIGTGGLRAMVAARTAS
jgi:drug/metabolite transporter (DMT)-like permease